MHTSVQLEMKPTLCWNISGLCWSVLKTEAYLSCNHYRASPFEPVILPKVGVIIGVANTNARFLAIVASVQHQEAKIRRFFTTIDVKTLLAARRNA